MTNVVEIKDLSKNYGKIQALDAINLAVPEGQIYGLIGPNGAGKTTLIKMLVGSLKPSKGEVEVLGLNPLQNKWELRKHIGYMPQIPALYDDLSAKNNIMFFGEAQNVANLESKVDEILAFAELSQRANDLVGTFSGGMKKRVSLCCALIHQPKIVFLDEPTAAIDPHLKIQSWNLFRQLAKTGVTLFISTHLMDEALLCDKIAILGNGQIIALDTPQKILERGKTQLKILMDGEIKESTISSTPESLATALHELGLNQTISSITLNPSNLESIVLDIIKAKKESNQ